MTLSGISSASQWYVVEASDAFDVDLRQAQRIISTDLSWRTLEFSELNQGKEISAAAGYSKYHHEESTETKSNEADPADSVDSLVQGYKRFQTVFNKFAKFENIPDVIMENGERIQARQQLQELTYMTWKEVNTSAKNIGSIEYFRSYGYTRNDAEELAHKFTAKNKKGSSESATHIATKVMNEFEPKLIIRKFQKRVGNNVDVRLQSLYGKIKRHFEARRQISDTRLSPSPTKRVVHRKDQARGSATFARSPRTSPVKPGKVGLHVSTSTSPPATPIRVQRASVIAIGSPTTLSSPTTPTLIKPPRKKTWTP